MMLAQTRHEVATNMSRKLTDFQLNWRSWFELFSSFSSASKNFCGSATLNWILFCLVCKFLFGKNFFVIFAIRFHEILAQTVVTGAKAAELIVKCAVDRFCQIKARLDKTHFGKFVFLANIAKAVGPLETDYVIK